MYNKKVVHLTITSWATIGIGSHWYGRLEWELDEEDLDCKGMRKWVEQDVYYVLDQEYADALNRIEDWRPDDDPLKAAYKAGEETTRFVRYEDVIKAALDQWKQAVPGGKALLLYNRGCCSPCEVLAGPKGLMVHGNKLAQAHRMDEDNWRVWDKQWEKLFQKHGLTDR